MFGTLIELLLALYGLFGQLNFFHNNRTKRVIHHNRLLHVTPDAPLLSYAFERGPAPRSSFYHNRTRHDGYTEVTDLCGAGEPIAHITDDDCLTEGCIDTVWIWEGIPHHEDGKYNFHSKSTLRLFDVFEEVTGKEVNAIMAEVRCSDMDASAGSDQGVNRQRKTDGQHLILDTTKQQDDGERHRVEL
jgi:hypothetical protein